MSLSLFDLEALTPDAPDSPETDRDLYRLFEPALARLSGARLRNPPAGPRAVAAWCRACRELHLSATREQWAEAARRWLAQPDAERAAWWPSAPELRPQTGVGAGVVLTDEAAWEQVAARCRAPIALPESAADPKIRREIEDACWLTCTRGLAEAQVRAADYVRSAVQGRGRRLSEALATHEGIAWCRAAFLRRAAQARAEGALGMPGPVAGAEPWRQGPAQIEDLMTPEELAERCRAARGALRFLAGGQE